MFYLFYSYFLSRTAFNVAFKTKLTHYETLGLSPTATTRDIREAFIRLSKQVHNFTLRFRFNSWIVWLFLKLNYIGSTVEFKILRNPFLYSFS